MEQAIRTMIEEREHKAASAARRAADARKHGAELSARRNQSRADALRREIATLTSKLDELTNKGV